MIKFISSSFLILATMTCEAITLPELEQSLIVNERRIQISNLDAKIAEAQLKQREAESGWKAFANANGGSTTQSLSNPGTQAGSSQYGTYGYTAGLSYPLLGTQAAQQKKISEAKKLFESGKYDSETIKRQALQDLRQSYLNLWVSQEQMKLAESYLGSKEKILSIISKRTAAGLILASDEKDFQAGFAEVESLKSQAQELNELSKKNIFYLTGIPANSISNPSPPNFIVKITVDQDRPNQQPELMAAQLKVELQKEYISKANWEGVEASVNVSYNDGRQYWNPTVPSSNALIGLNLTMPLDINKYQDAAKAEKIATLEKLRLDSEEKKARYTIDSESAIFNYRKSISFLKVAELERLAAQKSLDETTLRSKILSGDVIEKQIQDRYTYFKLANKKLNYWLQSQLAAIQLATLGFPIEFSSGANGLNSSILSPETASARKNLTLAMPTGVFVWRSNSILSNPAKSIQEWQSYGISSVLIGLTQSQITSSNSMELLKNLVSQSHDSNIRIKVVLGEASWILPEHRPKLLQILTQLSDTNIDAINLDLEIEQLPQWESRKNLLREDWFATLTAASNATNIPIEATFHSRHLEITGLKGRLAAAKVKSVSIMSFTTNQSRSLEINDLAHEALQGINYVIVKSVESHLPATESYAKSGLNRLVELSVALKNQGAVGIQIQSWENLKNLSQ